MGQKHGYPMFVTFNSRYTRHRQDPDQNDYLLLHSMGEFSPMIDMAFEKHLKVLYNFKQGAIGKNPV